MKHSIREHIVDPIRGKVVKISTINAELGTGITDKNGKEIFEGDIVRCTYQGSFGFNEYEFPVMYKDGVLWAGKSGYPKDAPLAVGATSPTNRLEVVGHVED